MKKEELEKELRQVLEQGHSYVSCGSGDIDLEYTLLDRKCNLCILSILAKNLVP